MTYDDALPPSERNYPLDAESDLRSKTAPMGVAEIAVLLDIKPRSVHQAIRRKTLPEAQYASVNGGVAWDRTVIVRWAGEKGRIKPDNAELRAEYRHQEEADPRPYVDRRPKSAGRA